MICIRHQDFWAHGSRGDASLSQPFHAVCHLFRYLNREPSSRKDAVTVWNMSIKLWTLFMLLPPCLITPPILCWAHEPSPPRSLHHGVITASFPFPPPPHTYTIFYSRPQLWMKLRLLGESREKYFGKGQGWFGCSGAAAGTEAVSRLGPQANKYGAYREVWPNQAAYINIYF